MAVVHARPLDVAQSDAPTLARWPERTLRRHQSTGASRYLPPATDLVLAIALVLTGCANEDDRTGGDAPSPKVSAAEQDARGRADQLALDAYRGMWRAYAQAGLTADAGAPGLTRYASGDALRTLTSGLAGYRSKGQVLKGTYKSNPQASDASPPSRPTTVTVTDCLDDTTFLVYHASGERADDEPGGRRATRATVSDLGAEGWKVTSFGVQEVGTC